MKVSNNLLDLLFIKNIRKYATKTKCSAVMESQLIDRINADEIKPRKHPGVMKTRISEVPAMIINAMQAVMKDKPVKAFRNGGADLARYLKDRHVPVEEGEIQAKGNKIQQQIEVRLGIDSLSLSPEQQEELKFRFKEQVIKRLKQAVNYWRPVEYDEYKALLYMVARFAPEYMVLKRIFMELKTRDPDFQPRSLFDFGSGVGTATWAARAVWGDLIKEVFNVDSSRDMNDLASLLLRGGSEEADMPIKGVSYRQFLPASHMLKYDVVVSAYTLLELPSARTRLETIINLWNKTNKYFIIVEQGTNAGFKMKDGNTELLLAGGRYTFIVAGIRKSSGDDTLSIKLTSRDADVINEARDFILQLNEGKEMHSSTPVAHIFSPCPHDLPCPRFLHNTTPCNFEVSYIPLPFEERRDVRKERFSYVVIKKGPRPPSDVQWPRIVRKPLVRRKHTICRICVASGKLEEIIFTASKHGKIPYWCARSSNWGDLLPMTVKDEMTEE